MKLLQISPGKVAFPTRQKSIKNIYRVVLIPIILMTINLSVYNQISDTSFLNGIKTYKITHINQSCHLLLKLQTGQPKLEELEVITGKEMFRNKEYRLAFQYFDDLYTNYPYLIECLYYKGLALCHTDSVDYYPSAFITFQTFLRKAETDTSKFHTKLREVCHYMGSYYLNKSQSNLDSALFYTRKMYHYSQNSDTFLSLSLTKLMVIYIQKKDLKSADSLYQFIQMLYPKNQNSIPILKKYLEWKTNYTLYFWQDRLYSLKSIPKIKENLCQQFNISYSKNAISPEIINFLTTMIPGFSIADPGEEWEETDCLSGRDLPTRQLLFILKNDQNTYIVFQHGGIGVCKEFIWIEHNGKEITDFWASSFLFDLKSTEDFRSFILNQNLEPIYLKYL